MVADEFIRRRTVDLTLRDGTPIRVRPIRPDDKELLVEGMRRLSPESRYRRFFSPVETLSPTLLRRLTEIDYVDHFAWIVLSRESEEVPAPAIAVGRYIRLSTEPTCAEVAITVRDDYQARGLGAMLLEILGLVARDHAITEFTAVVLPENSPMRHLLSDEGIDLQFDADAGALRGTGPIPVAEELHSDLGNQFLAALGEWNGSGANPDEL